MGDRLRWLVPGLLLALWHFDAPWYARPAWVPPPYPTAVAWASLVAAVGLAALPWLARPGRRWAGATLLAASPWLVGVAHLGVLLAGFSGPRWSDVPNDGLRVALDQLSWGASFSVPLLAGLAMTALPAGLRRRGPPRVAVVLAVSVTLGAMLAFHGRHSDLWPTGFRYDPTVRSALWALGVVLGAAILGAPRAALARASLLAGAALLGAFLSLQATLHASAAYALDDTPFDCSGHPQYLADAITEEPRLLAIGPWLAVAVGVAGLAWLGRGSSRRRLLTIAPVALVLFAVASLQDATIAAVSSRVVAARPAARVSFDLPQLPIERSRISTLHGTIRADGTTTGRADGYVAAERGARWSQVTAMWEATEALWSTAFVVAPAGPPDPWRAAFARALPWYGEVYARDRYGVIEVDPCSQRSIEGARWRGRVEADGSFVYVTPIDEAREDTLGWGDLVRRSAEEVFVIDVHPDARIEDVLEAVWIEGRAFGSLCLR